MNQNHGIALKKQALDALKYWLQSDVKLIKKILELLESINQDPFKGLGKPKALKGNLKGYWSRRINDEHRLV